MIDYLKGQLAHRETEYVVLDVGGVGYRVFCANPFGVHSADDGRVTLFIHYHVRDDAILLYGFTSREEQELFRKLLEVTGIGPRVALGVLSAGRPEAVATAIYQEDVAFLTRLPGIGKKTAQRIILDLKDKLSGLPASHAYAAAPGSTPDSGMGAAWHEAKQALMALGYSEGEVDRARQSVQQQVSGNEAVDALIKLGLQALFRG